MDVIGPGDLSSQPCEGTRFCPSLPVRHLHPSNPLNPTWLFCILTSRYRCGTITRKHRAFYVSSVSSFSYGFTQIPAPSCPTEETSGSTFRRRSPFNPQPSCII